ncbi:19228_t:CDS:2, partial [Funneliformis geosporum]
RERNRSIKTIFSSYPKNTSRLTFTEADQVTLWPMLGLESAVYQQRNVLRPYGSALWPMLGLESADMNFERYIEEYANGSDPVDWSILNCLNCLKDNDDLIFTSDSKQDILYAFIRTFKKIIESSFAQSGAKKKAKKIFDSINDTFERREIREFFEELDHEYEIRKTDREVYKSVDTAKVLITKKATARLGEALEIQERRSNKKRKTKGNVDVEPNHNEMESSSSKHQEKSKMPKRQSTESNDFDDNEIEDAQECNPTDFDIAYHKLDPAKMWTLESSGRVVEKVIYEYARKLTHESYLHSFIVNDIDVATELLFSKEEWKEITTSEVKAKPKLEPSHVELLKKYTTDNIKKLRKALSEPLVPDGGEFDRNLHFDLDFINFAYRGMLFLWEKDVDPFDSTKLEVEDLVRKIQVVGILNGANMIQVITMDYPKGYISRVQRRNVREVAGRLSKSDPLALVLKEVICAKSIIKQTLDIINKKNSVDIGIFLNDSDEQYSDRTKDVINEIKRNNNK